MVSAVCGETCLFFIQDKILLGGGGGRPPAPPLPAPMHGNPSPGYPNCTAAPHLQSRSELHKSVRFELNKIIERHLIGVQTRPSLTLIQ